MLWVLGCCLRYTFFREHVFFSCFRPNPYTRMCVSTIGWYSTFGKNMKKHSKSPVESWVFGFSLIFDFLGLFEEFIEDNISPLGWGTMFQVLKVLEGTGPPHTATSPRSCGRPALSRPCPVLRPSRVLHPRPQAPLKTEQSCRMASEE